MRFAMKRLFLCAALAAVMMLSGCSAMKIERGLDASGAFVSSASPSVTVQTSADFSSLPPTTVIIFAEKMRIHRQF